MVLFSAVEEEFCNQRGRVQGDHKTIQPLEVVTFLSYRNSDLWGSSCDVTYPFYCSECSKTLKEACDGLWKTLSTFLPDLWPSDTVGYVYSRDRDSRTGTTKLGYFYHTTEAMQSNVGRLCQN